ncbi:MAG: ribosomal RNA small subunit methyltransferase A [Clostridia bacterium]|nr:ribosomal RNA small subunit methyltransferase A [Clostridia bacterium]
MILYGKKFCKSQQKEGKMSEILSRHGFIFQKKYGQNFLRDVKIPRRIASECTEYGFETKEGEKIPALVLEIGPGAGILTKELSERFQKVLAVEIDENLKDVLSETLADCGNVKVVFGDIMKTDLETLLEAERIDKNGEKLPVSVCANLPYYITTPIIMKLVETYGKFDFITVMVQKEMASRLCAKEKSAEYGSITASLNLYGSVKRLFTVPAGCFFPKPKVDSAVIRISMHNPPKYTKEQVEKAGKVIKAAFSVRRKTLVNALSSALGCDKEELKIIIKETLGVPENVRGEELSTEQFVKLSEKLLP